MGRGIWKSEMEKWAKGGNGCTDGLKEGGRVVWKGKRKVGEGGSGWERAEKR